MTKYSRDEKKPQTVISSNVAKQNWSKLLKYVHCITL